MAADGEELERLVARLVGDATSYLKMLEDAQSASKKAAKEVEQTAKQIEGTGSKLITFGHAAAGAFAAMGAESFLHHAAKEWEIAEATAIKLTAALRANGREVEETLKDYEEFATATEKWTRLGDDSVLMLLKQAESYGLTGDAAKDAANNAIALAAATDTSADAALRLVANVEKGNMEMAMMSARMIRELRGIHNEAEFMQQLNSLLEAGFTAEAELAATAAGQTAQLKNEYGNLQEELGKVVSEGLIPAIKATKELVVWARQLPDWVKKGAVTILAMGVALGTVVAMVGGIKLVGAAIVGAVASAASLAVALAANPYVQAAVAIGFLVLAYVKLREAIALSRQSVKDFNEAQKLSARLDSDLHDRFSSTTDAILEEGKAIDNTSDRLAYFQEQLRMANVELGGMNTAASEAAANLVELNTWLNRRIQPKLIEQAQGALDTLSAHADDGRDRVKKLQGAINELNKEMRKQSASDAKEAAAAFAEALAKAADEAHATAKALTSDMDSTIDSLEAEIDMFGESADAIKLYTLQLRAAKAPADAENDARLKRIAGLVEEKQKLEDAKKAADELDKMFEEGVSIAESVDPLIKFNNEIDKLARLLSVGAISEEIFELATAEANRQLEEAQKQADKARESIERLDAALSGSAEARSRILEFIARNEDERTNRRSPAQNGSVDPYGNMWLKDIARNTAKMANKSSVEVAPADLG